MTSDLPSMPEGNRSGYSGTAVLDMGSFLIFRKARKFFSLSVTLGVTLTLSVTLTETEELSVFCTVSV